MFEWLCDGRVCKLMSRGSDGCAQVKGKAEKLGVHINWMGRRDHLDPVLQDYQVSQGFQGCQRRTCLQPGQ